MSPRRKSRLYLAMVVIIGAALTLYALRANIDLFYTQAKSFAVKGRRTNCPTSVSVCASAAWSCPVA